MNKKKKSGLNDTHSNRVNTGDSECDKVFS